MTSRDRTVVHQRFAVPAERVFAAWLSPTLIGRWMFGPEVHDERIVRLGVEPRVGGRFSFVINRDGAEVEYTGRYLELDHSQLLVCTWGGGDARPSHSRIVVEITPDGVSGCELTLTHVPGAEPGGLTDEPANSWQRRLGALAHILAPTDSFILQST